MFKAFRALLAAVVALADASQAISAHLKAGLDRTEADGALRERVEDLELTRAKWEAEMDAMILKADSTLRAASNAEARERSLRKSNEAIFGPLGEDLPADGEAGHPPILVGDAAPSGEEGMHPVHMGVEAPNKKTLALRYKFS